VVGEQFSNLRRRVVVTGAANGIGRGLVEALAAAGSDVAAADLDLEGVRALAGSQGDGAVHPLAVDVTDPVSIKAAIDAAEEAMGGIDGLVVSAGGFPAVRRIEELTDEEWEKVIKVNLYGAFATCRAAFPALKRSGGGSIVCVSSEAGRAPGWITGVHYVAAKAGMIGLVRHLALEGGPSGIRANAVAPGTTLTDRVRTLYSDEQEEALATATPLGRLAEVDEQVGPILFLLSDGAAYINGATLDVNGGRLMQ
jgi:NAD(P)-dependent dehydrogenase (short-subunit alcohol dehydrogenase family)